MIEIPITTPPMPRTNPFVRHVPAAAAGDWLCAGWRDMMASPGPSLAYGAIVTLLVVASIASMRLLGLGSALFPALAGALIIGPALAVGPYEKSRLLAAGDEASWRDMFFVRPASGTQILFVGVLLCLWMVLWMRAAVIIYALFFGLHPFPGLAQVSHMLFTTPAGWLMLVSGSLVGALFAGLGFAVSVLSIPILMAEKTDALTAMAVSLAIVWNNLPVMLAWGAIVVAVSIAGATPAGLGLIVAFPVLGHGTWHAYSAMRR